MELEERIRPVWEKEPIQGRISFVGMNGQRYVVEKEMDLEVVKS